MAREGKVLFLSNYGHLLKTRIISFQSLKQNILIFQMLLDFAALPGHPCPPTPRAHSSTHTACHTHMKSRAPSTHSLSAWAYHVHVLPHVTPSHTMQKHPETEH